MKKINKETENQILDHYEQEIEASIPEDFRPIYMSDKEKEQFKKIAQKHTQYKSSKRINIRIKNEDLIKVKIKAKESNIPYQTLLSALIHKFAKNDVNITL
ncbi:hypothetical protein A3A93_00200 [Candidatus Roizmanbacteria bacterium RIFCSPLOWO2_01_FULL_38_12]|uniref:Antitoxin n=1 Tax=Candidatus Roizmanbacteria bacterium RIFCSPLOWO2_01_FULL_38_12 TaxID=1802061 RepID=A0A1F7IUB9_9BACT|nr:MAG: hypothetical protein A2861_00960 [Candidatus Roizmanbacteria bacterium RIFCSPHIGHO2_01_FULL_38_15]OGK34688.1 MAG: hypothetical protein A3F59_01020 [Candidatus Roizmanbacteria bacterium RIFCSPHIGHO2_12_FULL_38_13]OGK46963.1 MAG: hypothetical protein A3A93_00200 [Candidatus Roizmanbacteria bacterium RIFCSPLOWO2_01_FULL_38_12]